MTEIIKEFFNLIKEISYLPLRLVMGILLVILLLVKREVPQQLWDLVVPPKIARIIPLR